jgi:hypothetical protein
MTPILDHAVIDVREGMDEAVRLYRRLGFTLTPRGHHTLGSINHLAMFDQNYLELIGFGDGTRGELAPFPRGLNGLVFKTDDAESVWRAATSAGLPVLPVAAFSRPVSVDGEVFDARFRTTRLDPAHTGIGRVYFCEHLTPELVWRPEWQRHPNGALTIARLLISAADPGRVAGLFAALFHADRVSRDPQGASLQAGNARIEARTHAAVAAELGDAAPDPAGRSDFMAALAIRVAALEAVVRLLSGVPGIRATASRVVVPARACGNVTLIFTA